MSPHFILPSPKLLSVILLILPLNLKFELEPHPLLIFAKSSRSFGFQSKNLSTEFSLILQDYSPEEFDSHFATWEFCIYNTQNDEYIDSRFFTSSEMAIKYFISKIKYSV